MHYQVNLLRQRINTHTWKVDQETVQNLLSTVSASEAVKFYNYMETVCLWATKIYKFFHRK